MRGMKNARSSKTNMAASLLDTIMTTSHDIAVQVVSWFVSGPMGSEEFERLRLTLRVMLGADDLADAYHGLPSGPSPSWVCVKWPS